MRAKHIKRKKAITSHYGDRRFAYSYYPHDGMFSKGKIHCSCRMCRGKDFFGRHIVTKQELAAMLKMSEEMRDSD